MDPLQEKRDEHDVHLHFQSESNRSFSLVLTWPSQWWCSINCFSNAPANPHPPTQKKKALAQMLQSLILDVSNYGARFASFEGIKIQNK